ncbi:MAG TPA: winged helix-turn-helix domain-containing protein [Spirochaetia bacterium]|nr:winged helix-turn-helix domain-containing protein [Spirochaetia bacterium]
MAIRINVISTDAVLARRLSVFSRRIDKLRITTTESPLPEARVDAYVVPVDRIGTLFDGEARPATWLPVVAYGEEGGLRAAFAAGCKDYLREPWSPQELSLRIARLVESPTFCLGWGNLSLTPGSARTAAGSVSLSIQEYRILRVLLTQSGNAVPREVLYYALWGRCESASRAVDVHISSLRKKLKTIAPPSFTGCLIRSARGCGYFIPRG